MDFACSTAAALDRIVRQGLYGSLKNRAAHLVAKLWRGVLWQSIMGNRNQSPELVQKHDLARLVCRTHGLRMFDRGCLRPHREQVTPWVHDPPRSALNRDDVHRAADERATIIDEHASIVAAYQEGRTGSCVSDHAKSGIWDDDQSSPRRRPPQPRC